MKQRKPDEYFSNGLLEIARYGKLTQIKNIMSPEEHQNYVQRKKLEYDTLKQKIDNLVHHLQHKFGIKGM